MLDLFHLLQRLWAVACCFHTEGSDEAKGFVEQRLRDLLPGRGGPDRWAATEAEGREAERPASPGRPLGAGIAREQQGPLRYGEYLAEGYPLSSGVPQGDEAGLSPRP